MDFLLRISTNFHCKCNIFSDSFSGKKFKILKNNSEISAILKEFFRRKFAYIIASIIENVTRFVFFRSDKSFNESSFSTSRRTDEKNEFSLFYFEINIVQNGSFAVCDRNMRIFHIYSAKILRVIFLDSVFLLASVAVIVTV